MKPGDAIQVAKYHWEVLSMDESRFDKGSSYHVIFNPKIKSFSCNCPNFLFRKDGKPCKHIEQVGRIILGKNY